MAETLPSPSEKTVVVPSNQINRLWTLTIISLVLSGFIILLLLVGAIVHHHQMRRALAEREGRFEEFRDRGFGRHMHRFGGMGMNEGWGRPQGFRGGPGMSGMRGMMEGDKGGPPDPAKMSETILDHLSQKLSLTEDEKTKIKPIIDQQVAEIQKQMEAQRAVMKKEIEDAKAKIKPLLTTDQQKQLDAMPLPGQKPGP